MVSIKNAFFLNELRPTEKSYTVPFNEILLCSSFVKSCDTLPKQKLYKLVSSLFYFVFGLLKLILFFFSCYSVLSLMPWVRFSLNKLFFDYQYEMMNYYQHEKLQHFQQSHYQNSMNLLHQMLFLNHYK